MEEGQKDGKSQGIRDFAVRFCFLVISEATFTVSPTGPPKCELNRDEINGRANMEEGVEAGVLSPLQRAKGSYGMLRTAELANPREEHIKIKCSDLKTNTYTH